MLQPNGTSVIRRDVFVFSCHCLNKPSFISLCLVRNHKGFVLRWRLWTDFIWVLFDVLVCLRIAAEGWLINIDKIKEIKVPNVRKWFQHGYWDAWQLKKATVYARVSTHREVPCHTQCALTEHKLMNEKVNSVKRESWFWHEVPLEETVCTWLLWVA